MALYRFLEVALKLAFIIFMALPGKGYKSYRERNFGRNPPNPVEAIAPH